MHLINEIDYFSSLKVIFDINFFDPGLLFIFICISTLFLFNICAFRLNSVQNLRRLPMLFLAVNIHKTNTLMKAIFAKGRLILKTGIN